MIRHVLVAATLIVLVTSCATARAASPTDTVDAFLAALDRADSNVAELFTDDATVFFPMSDRPLRANGRREIASAFAALFAMPGYQTGRGMPKAEALRVQMLGGVALVTFQTTNRNVTSRRTFVLRRRGQAWRIVHLHGSNIRAGTAELRMGLSPSVRAALGSESGMDRPGLVLTSLLPGADLHTCGSLVGAALV